MTLDTVLKNSLTEMGVPLEQQIMITESDPSVTSADISTFASQVGGLIKTKYKTSLVYDICEIQPLTTPVGSIFTLAKTNVSGTNWKFYVKRTAVETVSKPISSGFTNEVWQDFQAQFGKDANDMCASILGSVSASVETTDLMNLIKANALAYGSVLADKLEVGYGLVGECIAKMNQNTFRTMSAWVIMPASIIGNIITNPNYFLSDSLDTKSNFLMYKFGLTRYYVNPDPLDLTIYVGLNGKEPGTSSVIFSPYQYTTSIAVNQDTGNSNIFVFNRYAITVNPLHVLGDEMIYSINVV